jgi:hypothetical protein
MLLMLLTELASSKYRFKSVTTEIMAYKIAQELFFSSIQSASLRRI